MSIVMTQNRQIALVLLVLAALVTAFWWPTLFEGKTLIHGDSIVHGLPLMDLHARALHGDASLLWSEQIYGGHPLFAEGQGAFAHPLNIFLAAFVPPFYGHNLFHFICMLLLGAGTFGLCRCLGASVWSAGFAAIAATFATTNTGAQQNMSIGGTITWIPWVLWAFEYWLKTPNYWRATLFAIACSLMVLAGYPQLFHGVVVYMAVSLLATPFSAQQRAHWQQHWRHIFTSGVFAIFLCIGLVAVQLLPLLELTTWSHRAEGVGLIPFMPFDALPYLRGAFFNPVGIEGPAGGYVPSVGSVLVCAVAMFCILLRTPSRLLGHVVAVLLLFQLGMGVASPLFRVLYTYHLLPGLNFFRTMMAYLNVSSVGVAVLAAFGIDALINLAAQQKTKTLYAALAATLAFCLLLGVRFLVADLSPVNVWLAVVALVIAVLLVMLQRVRWVSHVLFAALAIECAVLHLSEFRFGDVGLLAKPSTYDQFRAQSDLNDSRFLDVSSRAGYAFTSARSPKLDLYVRYNIAGYVAMTNLIFGMSSINGALALPTKARMLLDPVFREEIAGKSVLAAGQRAVDLLSIRYLVANDNALSSFPVAIRDNVNATWFLENRFARPRLQGWTRHVAVSSPEQAITLLKTARDEALIIETSDAALLPATEKSNRSDALRFDVKQATSTRYVVDVDADADGWFFLADANYSGWRATVDGESTHVYTANVLGKAVRVPQGRHQVALYFESDTFRVGLWCSVMSVLLVLMIVVGTWRAKLRGTRQA